MTWPTLNRMLAGILASACLVSGALAQTTYYVDGSCGSDSWSGTSQVCAFPNGPKRTIQAGIDTSVTGDTVIVADGTYTGTGNRDIDFGGRDIHLRSESLDPTLCIIDCQGSAGTPHRGFYFHSGETSAAIVEGFAIRGGYADGSIGFSGGAALCEASNPTFRGCSISNNTAFGHGGGIACVNSGATIESCTFTNNASLSTGSRGGGFFAESSTVIRDSLFTGNDAGAGGGIWAIDAMILNCIVSDNTSSFDAGGIQCYTTSGGSSLIEGCTITRNTSPAINGGAGISCVGTVTIADCVVADNVATVGSAGGIGTSGGDTVIRNCDVLRNRAARIVGGIRIRSDTTIITGCRIRDNVCSNNFVTSCGGIMIVVVVRSGTIIDCQITGNRAIGDNAAGGGIFMGAREAFTIENCLITGNSSGLNGGGIWATEGTEIVNCVITGNHAGLDGGGLWCTRRMTIEDCTIAGNTAGSHGGGLAVSGSGALPTDVLMDNCILWDNSAPAGSQIALLDFLSGVVLYPGQIEVARCDVQGGQSAVHVDLLSTLNWLAGNINVDPLFVDPANGDYHIQSGSLVIDAGDNTLVPAGVTTDLDGNPRFVDDPNTPNTGVPGNGFAEIVDMGAYEFPGEFCYADCDGNGVLDIFDFLCFQDAFVAGCP